MNPDVICKFYCNICKFKKKTKNPDISSSNLETPKKIKNKQWLYQWLGLHFKIFINKQGMTQLYGDYSASECANLL